MGIYELIVATMRPWKIKFSPSELQLTGPAGNIVFSEQSGRLHGT